jgi:hypothetical protein
MRFAMVLSLFRRALQNGERDFVRFAKVLWVSCRALQNGERDVGRFAKVLLVFWSRSPKRMERDRFNFNVEKTNIKKNLLKRKLNPGIQKQTESPTFPNFGFSICFGIPGSNFRHHTHLGSRGVPHLLNPFFVGP